MRTHTNVNTNLDTLRAAIVECCCVLLGDVREAVLPGSSGDGKLALRQSCRSAIHFSAVSCLVYTCAVNYVHVFTNSQLCTNDATSSRVLSLQ